MLLVLLKFELLRFINFCTLFFEVEARQILLITGGAEHTCAMKISGVNLQLAVDTACFSDLRCGGVRIHVWKKMSGVGNIVNFRPGRLIFRIWGGLPEAGVLKPTLHPNRHMYEADFEGVPTLRGLTPPSAHVWG